MNHIKQLIILSALGLTLAANPATYGAESPATPTKPETPTAPETPPAPEIPTPPTDPATPAAPATPATPTTPTDPVTPASPATPAAPADPVTPTNPETLQPETPVKPDTSVKPQAPPRPDRPQKPDQAAKPQIPDEVKKAIEEAKAQRTEYLNSRAELLKSLKGADAQGREQIRAKLRENREQFLAQQRDSRADLRKNIQELKDTLADHGDVLDHAKEQAKDNVKVRKGGE